MSTDFIYSYFLSKLMSCDEIDYTSDETSNDEDDIKGLDEEMKIMRNIGKKMKQMIENESEFDFDHDDEDISDL
ncbi:unnamed protein product, partial [Rotaria sp. Silwood1]